MVRLGSAHGRPASVDFDTKKSFPKPSSPILLSLSPKLSGSPRARRWSQFLRRSNHQSSSDYSSCAGESGFDDIPIFIIDGQITSEDDKDAPLVKGAPGKDKFASLTSRDSLREALESPLGLARFGDFLAKELGAEQLCFWLNSQQLSSDLKSLQSLCRRVTDLHVPVTAPLAVNLSYAERKELEVASSTLTYLPDPFSKCADAAFESMHQDSWSRFVKLRLTLAQKASVGKGQRNRDSFCLADLRDGPEQILSMASHGFETLSGYTLKETLSMNCRQLQGPDSSPEAVARIRQALKVGADIQELMINYKKDGTPFWVLLQMKCLRDESGEVRYILGHQLNLSAQTSDLSWLLSEDHDLPQGLHSEIVDLQKEAVLSSRSQATERIAKDRNSNVQQASALAFDAIAGRQTHSKLTRKPTFEVSLKPTSARAPLGVLGASSARVPRDVVTDLAQISDPSDVLRWQNQSPSLFLFLDPDTLLIRFSSPTLPIEWAQGCSFATLIDELNLPGAVQEIKKQIAKQEFFTMSPRLRVFPSGEHYHSEGRICPLAVTPLLNRKSKVSAVVVMFSF